MDMLNPNSPVPLYYQLAEILLSKIRSREYLPGARIPSEPSLAQTYGIGRPTVRQATDMLVRSGFLARRRGSGTFVQSEQKQVDLFSFAGTLTAFREKGISVARHILQKTRIKTIGQDPDNPFSGEPAYFFSRLSRVDDVPVLIEDMYLDTGTFSGIDRVDMTGRSLSQIVAEQYHLKPTGGKQTFRIAYVDGKRCHHLGVTAEIPILLVKRYLDFPQAKNAVYSELYCRTDRFIFSQTIGGYTDAASRLL
jgi:GntR family transcriptional regulator